MKKIDPVINDFLKNYRKNLSNDPIFRVVWSDDLTETRFGEFNDYYGNIFLRKFIGYRQVPKYNYINERWILEKWLPAEDSYINEVPNTHNGSYEPVYVFQDKDLNYLEPNLKIVKIVIFFSEGNVRKMTPSERQQLADISENEEVQDFIDRIDVTPVSNALAMKEGVGYGRLYSKGCDSIISTDGNK
jgi:hypothetical protein